MSKFVQTEESLRWFLALNRAEPRTSSETMVVSRPESE